jgi:putative hydrolase of the HAD superfamily
MFDYGGTLLYEPGYDWERGEVAVLARAVANPQNVTVKILLDKYAEIRQVTHKRARECGLELREPQVSRLVMGLLELEFDETDEELERIFWDGCSRGAKTPHIDDLLAFLRKRNIRTAVISNICYTGASLAERINRLLPDNSFEFILASSDVAVRKPSSLIFEYALKKAKLSAGEVWYCGDSVNADVHGAAAVGVHPVWYQCGEDIDNYDGNEGAVPVVPHTLIRDWRDMIELVKQTTPQ